MNFLQRIIIGLSLAFVTPLLLASDMSMKELEEKIKIKEVQLQAEQLDFNENRKSIQKAISDFKQQEKNINAMKGDLDALKQQLTVAKVPPQPQPAKPEKSKLGENSDDVPCTCVFNKNRAWNPEKIIWKENFWECTNYKDDGTCTRVGIVEGSVVE